MAKKGKEKDTYEEVLEKLAEAFFEGFKEEIQREKELRDLEDIIADELLW
ncbi:MAG: hypothetical protein QXP66_00960 [Candidatus Aenigmatarchaeota archaeon]